MPHVAFYGSLELTMAQAAQGGGPVRPWHMARSGYTACDVAECVFADRRRRPVSACMVEVAPQMRGASAWRARGRRTVRIVPSALRARLAGTARRAGAGGATKGVECGKQGGDSGRYGESALSRGESSHGLSDLQLTAMSSFLYTQSNIFEFMPT